VLAVVALVTELHLHERGLHVPGVGATAVPLQYFFRGTPAVNFGFTGFLEGGLIAVRAAIPNESIPAPQGSSSASQHKDV
jgi:hypothetical protein